MNGFEFTFLGLIIVGVIISVPHVKDWVTLTYRPSALAKRIAAKETLEEFGERTLIAEARQRMIKAETQTEILEMNSEAVRNRARAFIEKDRELLAALPPAKQFDADAEMNRVGIQMRNGNNGV